MLFVMTVKRAIYVIVLLLSITALTLFANTTHKVSPEINNKPLPANYDNKIILHHTAGSPYAEKIRLMLGYTNTDWLSVIAPSNTVERPVQEKLVGGYSRRIPIMQIGSDIFCDSYIITEELARLTDKPELGTSGSSKEVKEFISDEGTYRYKIFLNSLRKREIAFAYFRNMPFKEFRIFIKGRLKATKVADLTKMKYRVAVDERNRYINSLDSMLNTHEFILSDSSPTLADFSAYHMLWWYHRLHKSPISDNQTNLERWYNKMSQFRKEDGTELIPEQSLQIAKMTQPREVPAHMKKSANIGKQVSILPNDYVKGATLPVKGILVGEDDTRYIIRRETPETRVVHIHMPKHAYGACL
jgi:glutathione S-transferase